MPAASDFAEWLAAAIKAAGITQTELAQAVGVTKWCVWSWLHCGKEPRSENRERIEAFLATRGIPRPADASRCVTGYTYPLQTTVGVAWGPAVDVPGGCDDCPHLVPCKRSVDAGNFAFCEAVAPWDLDPGYGVQVERWEYCDLVDPAMEQMVTLEGRVTMAEAARAGIGG